MPAFHGRNLLAAGAYRIWAKVSAGVDVVTFLATVRDREGLLVKNLNWEESLSWKMVSSTEVTPPENSTGVDQLN